LSSISRRVRVSSGASPFYPTTSKIRPQITPKSFNFNRSLVHHKAEEEFEEEAAGDGSPFFVDFIGF
jgi:hypothetical protein